MIRRRFLGLVAAATSWSLLESLPTRRAYPAALQPDLRFRALNRGAQVGEHRVTFRQDGDRLVIGTKVDITIRVLFFTAFRFKHRAEEIWQSERLVSVKSTTDDNGTALHVSGYSAKDGFRMLGNDGPFLASGHLLTTNSLWNSGIVRESRLIDIQHGSEVGLVVTPLGEEQVSTPQGPVSATRYQLLTPHYAGSVFYDGNGRWVKGLIEKKGEVVEYALSA